MPQIFIKRIYNPPAGTDGVRVLVDRLWPRGVKKEVASIDIWMKEIAPSTPLRKLFHYGELSWKDFTRDYQDELETSPAVKELLQILKEKPAVTLLYAAKDEKQNHALVLKSYLEQVMKKTTF